MKLYQVILAVVSLSLLSAGASAQTSTVKSASAQVVPARRAIKTDKAPLSSGPLSQAIIAGNFVFASGQLGVDPKTGEFAGSGLEEQAEQIFRNLSAVLEAGGSDLEHVVKTTVFLADMNDFSAMNEIYRRHFKGDPPARSTVQVARLPRNARIEIEAIAVVKNR